MARAAGGESLAKRLRDLSNKLGTGKLVLRVGFLENSHYPGNGMPTAAIAAFQEFGTPNARWPIPPRPFFVPMVQREKASWAPKLVAILRRTHLDPVRALELLGDDIAGALRKSIIDVTSPELSTVTLILRKRFGNTPSDIGMNDVLEAISDARLATATKLAKGALRIKVGRKSMTLTPTRQKPLVWTGHLLNSIDREVKEQQA